MAAVNDAYDVLRRPEARRAYDRDLAGHAAASAAAAGSVVDDPAFFASARGKHDPEAELEALAREIEAVADSPAPYPVWAKGLGIVLFALGF